MSAHELMNMARVRAEQAEARAERAEKALAEVYDYLALRSHRPDDRTASVAHNILLRHRLFGRGFGDAS